LSQHLLEDVLVERQIRHETLQARILLTHLPQLADLGYAQAAVLLLPEIEGRFGDAPLPRGLFGW